jgi:hypothetical protein
MPWLPNPLIFWASDGFQRLFVLEIYVGEFLQWQAKNCRGVFRHPSSTVQEQQITDVHTSSFFRPTLDANDRSALFLEPFLTQ